MCVFFLCIASNSDSVVPETEKLSLEGRVQQKLECRPPSGNETLLLNRTLTFCWPPVNLVFLSSLFYFTANDKGYMRLKLETFRKAAEPTRKVQQLDRVVQNYKPVSNHKHNVSCKFF